MKIKKSDFFICPKKDIFILVELFRKMYIELILYRMDDEERSSLEKQDEPEKPDKFEEALEKTVFIDLLCVPFDDTYLEKYQIRHIPSE